MALFRRFRKALDPHSSVLPRHGGFVSSISQTLDPPSVGLRFDPQELGSFVVFTIAVCRRNILLHRFFRLGEIGFVRRVFERIALLRELSINRLPDCQRAGAAKARTPPSPVYPTMSTLVGPRSRNFAAASRPIGQADPAGRTATIPLVIPRTARSLRLPSDADVFVRG